MPIRMFIGADASLAGERGAEAIDVGPDIDRVAVVALLGGHVIERAHHWPVRGQSPASAVVLATSRARPRSRILTTPCADVAASMQVEA